MFHMYSMAISLSQKSERSDSEMSERRKAAREADDALVRKLLAAMVRMDSKSIDQLAERLGVPVHTLRDFCAQRKRVNFPLYLLPSLLEIAEHGEELRRFALGKRYTNQFRLGEAAADILSESAQRKLLSRRLRAKKGKR